MEGFASAFPIFSEADWRGAAEASLKGGSLHGLVSKTSDGIALEPLYGRREGARATRGSAGPWAVLARVDHPEPGDANAQAREDLATGANGLPRDLTKALDWYRKAAAQGPRARRISEASRATRRR